MTRFTFDDTTAALWLEDVTRAPEPGIQQFTLPPAWQPAADDSNLAGELVDLAQSMGVITAEGAIPARIAWELASDDGSEACYRWLVDVGERCLTLAGATDNILHLGLESAFIDRPAGPEAAMAVLREAVQEANLLLTRLDGLLADLTGT